MKRVIIILLLGLIVKPICSQGTYFFKLLSNDSIKIYFNKFGDVTLSDISEFYRIGKMDTFYFSFIGEVRDYNKKNELLFIGYYQNGRLNGPAKFYKNGLLNETGIYKNDLRDSIWTYYANNQVVKKMDFSHNNYKLLELNSKKGINQIENGICTYSDHICAYKNTHKLFVKGKFKNGLLEGKWMYGAYTEYYKDGAFIRGIDNMFKTEYLDGPKLTLLSFNPSEFTNFYCNFFTLLGKYDYRDTLFLPKYNGTILLNTSFFKSLEDTIYSLYRLEPEATYYLADIGISKENKIDYVGLYSPQESDKLNKIKIIINNSGKWEASRCGNRIYTSKIYFPIIIEKEEVDIPIYTGNHRDELIDYILHEDLK